MKNIRIHYFKDVTCSQSTIAQGIVNFIIFLVDPAGFEPAITAV